MKPAPEPVASSRTTWAGLSVRILTWVATVLFTALFALAPRGITVPWDEYLMVFGPVVLIDLAAILGFLACRVRHRPVSFAYLLMSLGVIVGIWYLTWFELRLRWYEVLR